MSTILEKINNPVEEIIKEEVKESLFKKSSLLEPVKELLKRKTGVGDLENYIDVPLNINKSKEIAHILRGISGLFGDLNGAIVDILVGSVKMIYKKFSKK